MFLKKEELKLATSATAILKDTQANFSHAIPLY